MGYTRKVYYKNIMVQIFRDHLEPFKERYPELVVKDVEENVQKMMGCGLEANGYFEYFCVKCGGRKVVAFTCKSRFCLRCSKVYIDNWTNKMRKTVFEWIPHRHVILTVPGSLWEYFHNKEMLKMPADCPYKEAPHCSSDDEGYDFNI